MGLFGRLRRLQVLAELEATSVLTDARLTSSELDVLVTIRHADQPMIARAVAALRGCSRAAMSNMLAKLEKRGLVTREPSPADRRATLIHLTPQGAQLVDEIFPQRLSLEAGLLSEIPQEQQEQIIESLDVLLTAMIRRSPLADTRI
ncbi:MarR family transcriptional regulator [Streptomyces sp. MB09-01]|uniref:MarR family winged helix-turn-helix transcriptional regulator n=1 Tax=Streptomyces sp. MB09-01 TaxID=3028666 RepID=UPI0029A4BB68|nr:MarR family transcriptional regulator [Streptomyces sp. MB09-01]MDX3537506.1 MarR family transcriptional regulator [Streptomyces sp. MB09-01]